MPETAKRGRGRPPKAEGERKRNNLTMRLRDETKNKLQGAAAANTRSLSEEAEARLDRSFEWEEAFGNARKILANAHQAVAANLRAQMKREGWTQVRGVDGAAWFEPGMEPNKWFTSNTPQAVVEDIAERAAVKAVKKVLGNEG